MGKLGVAEGDMELRGYRVLKPYGSWGYGDEFWTDQHATMNQAIRRGVVELIPGGTHFFAKEDIRAIQEKPTHKSPKKKADVGSAGL